MKTHRMYRHKRPEVPTILALMPGVNYIPYNHPLFKLMERNGTCFASEDMLSGFAVAIADPYKAPEQASLDILDEISPFDEAELERVRHIMAERRVKRVFGIPGVSSDEIGKMAP